MTKALAFWQEPPAVTHVMTCGGFDLIDETTCSCGWKSKPYYDGMEYAIADWRVHAGLQKPRRIRIWLR